MLGIFLQYTLVHIVRRMRPSSFESAIEGSRNVTQNWGDEVPKNMVPGWNAFSPVVATW